MVGTLSGPPQLIVVYIYLLLSHEFFFVLHRFQIDPEGLPNFSTVATISVAELLHPSH
jgi:hypothetical protein